MGIFGKSSREKSVEEAYVLLYNASSRLKQAIALFDNMDAVSKKAPWIERNELKFTVNALIRYANALTSFAEVMLGKTAGVDDRAFFNVALQPKFEDAVLSVVCGDQAREVKLAVHDFDQTDTGVPSVREVLVKVLDES
jgi:hypothetical protein